MSKIVHVEIPSTDYDKSKAFYEKVFGWIMTPMPEMDYMLWMPTDNNEDMGGGFTKTDKPCECGEGCIAIYIGVDSIDDTTKKIEEAGGAIAVPKTPVGDFGFSAVFKDTAGATVALYEAVPQK